MTFAERMTKQWRLAILQLLAVDGQNWNLMILRDAMGDLGHDVTVSDMASMADWLAAAGLVEYVTRAVPPVLRITPRGVSVTGGRLAVPGVDAPAP